MYQFVFVHGEIMEPFTIAQPLPRKELALDLTIQEALGPTTACMLIIEAGEGCTVAIDDLVDINKVHCYPIIRTYFQRGRSLPRLLLALNQNI